MNLRESDLRKIWCRRDSPVASELDTAAFAMATGRLRLAQALLDRYDAFECELLARPIARDPIVEAPLELQIKAEAAIQAGILDEFAEQHRAEILGQAARPEDCL